MKPELEEWYKRHKFHFYAGSYQTKDLAIFLGISPRTIQRWMKEKAAPSKEQIVQIKAYLAREDGKASL